MKFAPPIKGLYIKRKAPKTKEEILAENVEKTLSELQALKSELVETVNIKLDQIDSAIEEVKNIEVRDGEDGDPGVDGQDADEEVIVEKVLARIKIPEPKEAEKIDENKIIESLLKRLPKPQTINEKKLASRVASMLPDKKGDLKIIREQVTVDPLVIVDQIMNLPEEKIKRLKFKKDLDGMEQTIKAFRNQLARGYLHGGGSAGAVSVYAEKPSGLVNGVNVTYTLSRTPKAMLSLSINGMVIHPTDDYTITGQTITMTSPIDASLSGKPFTAVYI